MTVTVKGLAGVPSERLEHEVAQHAAAIAALTCNWFLMIAELDRRRAWASWECNSMAHWLSWRCGLAPRTGREHVRVARALEALPAITAAFAAGEISYSKVKALSRVATAATEADLLQLARNSTASQFERIAAAYAQIKLQADPEAPAKLLAARRFDVKRHDDGTVSIAIRRAPGDAAATILAAVEAALAEVPDDLDEPIAARRVDAIEAIARHYVAPDDSQPRPIDANLQVTRVPAVDDGPAGPLPAAFLDGLSLSIAAARELLCDSSVVVEVEQPDGTIAYTIRKKSIPIAARRATMNRDERRCRWHGCNRTHHLAVHHITYRSRRGNHAVSNLVALCPVHHRAVHRLGWTIVGDANDELVFVSPDGRRVMSTAPPMPAVPNSATDATAVDGALLRPKNYYRLDLDAAMWAVGPKHFPMN